MTKIVLITSAAGSIGCATVAHFAENLDALVNNADMQSVKPLLKMCGGALVNISSAHAENPITEK